MRRPTTALVVIAALVVAVALALRSNASTTDEGTTTSSAPSATTAPAAASSTAPTTSTSVTGTTTLSPAVPACSLYDEIVTTGSVESTDLVEASGLAVSRVADDVLWSHNDSRGDAALIAFDRTGADLGTFAIPDAFAIDWEDMAAGPDATGSAPYLYVGDMGDNFEIRAGIVNVWRVPDLDPREMANAFPESVALVYRMPDGPYDAEGLFVDPLDPALYIVTKDRDQAFVFRGSLESTGTTQDMELIATLFLGEEVSGADITSDGQIIAFRGYDTVWMWNRLAGQSVGDALSTEPCTAPSPEERQGESIAFDDQWGYYTISEGTAPDINHVPSGR